MSRVQQSKSILICELNWNYRDVWDSFPSSSPWRKRVWESEECRVHERSLSNAPPHHVPYVWRWFTAAAKWWGENVCRLTMHLLPFKRHFISSFAALAFHERAHEQHERYYPVLQRHLVNSSAKKNIPHQRSEQKSSTRQKKLFLT